MKLLYQKEAVDWYDCAGFLLVSYGPSLVFSLNYKLDGMNPALCLMGIVMLLNGSLNFGKSELHGKIICLEA
jgi:hypothetical protein